MKNRYSLFLAIILFFVPLSFTHAQVLFEGTEFLINEQELHSGVGMGFSDLNGDALDDLILIDRAKDLYVIYQTNGHAFRDAHFLGKVTTNRKWSVQTADINNDGIQDIFTAGSGDLTFLKSEGAMAEYEISELNAPAFLPQSSNFADMDDDGDLDLFVCNDDAENYIALNDGLGNFSRVNNFMDFSTDPPSDGSGNYGTTWCDYDRDGDLDLYISKCRLGTSPGDPERTNQFFENTENGFERIYDLPILLSNDQSWVADFVDVDNDGDWDILLANHNAPMNLFIQKNDSTFVDEAELRGIAFEAGVIQLISGDYDNDGDIDFFIPGSDHIMYLNDGNGYFEDAGFPESTRQIESASCGDINSDGLLDIYAGYANIYNDPSNVPDQLFINKSNRGKYIKFSLRGDSMNLYAIGATVEIFHGNNHQMREIRSGESYGINKTNIQHFGLDTISEIDSVKIFWPSGAVEIYQNLTANKLYQISKNIGIQEIRMDAISSDKSVLCPQDSLTLTGPVADQYLWSDSSTESSLTVHEAGVYTLLIRLDDHWLTLPSFQVMMESTDPPLVTYDGDLLKCATERLALSTQDSRYAVRWSNGSSDQSISITDSGKYFYRQQRFCNSYFSDTVSVRNINVERPRIENDTVVKFETATIHSTQEMTAWTVDTILQNILFTGNEFIIDSLERDSMLFAATVNFTPTDPESIGPVQPDTSFDGYHSTGLSGGMLFETFENCTLQSVLVYCRLAGPRTILIIDLATNMEVYRTTFDLVEGFNTIDLQAQLLTDKSYEITTDANANEDNLGFRSPDFMRSRNAVDFPFTGEALEITESVFGTGQFYYFYNWNVQKEDKVCYSPWMAVYAIVARNVAISPKELLSSEIQVFPNPARNEFYLELDNPEVWISANLYSFNGELIESFDLDKQPVYSVKNNYKGLCLIKINHRDGRFVMKKIMVY